MTLTTSTRRLMWVVTALTIVACAHAQVVPDISIGRCRNYRSSAEFTDDFINTMISSSGGHTALLTTGTPSPCRRLEFYSNTTFRLHYRDGLNVLRDHTGTYAMKTTSKTEGGHIDLNVPLGVFGSDLLGNLRLHVLEAKTEYFVVASCTNIGAFISEQLHVFAPTSTVTEVDAQAIKRDLIAEGFPLADQLAEVPLACSSSVSVVNTVLQTVNSLVSGAYLEQAAANLGQTVSDLGQSVTNLIQIPTRQEQTGNSGTSTPGAGITAQDVLAFLERIGVIAQIQDLINGIIPRAQQSLYASNPELRSMNFGGYPVKQSMYLPSATGAPYYTTSYDPSIQNEGAQTILYPRSNLLSEFGPYATIPSPTRGSSVMPTVSAGFGNVAAPPFAYPSWYINRESSFPAGFSNTIPGSFPLAYYNYVHFPNYEYIQPISTNAPSAYTDFTQPSNFESSQSNINPMEPNVAMSRPIDKNSFKTSFRSPLSKSLGISPIDAFYYTTQSA